MHKGPTDIYVVELNGWEQTFPDMTMWAIQCELNTEEANDALLRMWTSNMENNSRTPGVVLYI